MSKKRRQRNRKRAVKTANQGKSREKKMSQEQRPQPERPEEKRDISKPLPKRLPIWGRSLQHHKWVLNGLVAVASYVALCITYYQLRPQLTVEITDALNQPRMLYECSIKNAGFLSAYNISWKGTMLEMRRGSGLVERNTWVTNRNIIAKLKENQESTEPILLGMPFGGRLEPVRSGKYKIEVGYASTKWGWIRNSETWEFEARIMPDGEIRWVPARLSKSS